MSISLRAE